ncbi:MAG: S41 family peptidase [Bacteroidales bacterium]|nr:S41 family peptidase [Bacteroidales bacterium]MDY2859795.1 S41 family peptidase [Candidatus Cryptobacteroides sp.]MDY5443043.1 S41 family peptidase [Candidatus Cryptobacteroides sp.]MDY5570363.1 S41 family peptidase [Candidatus Cryptobacteroides sp.]
MKKYLLAAFAVFAFSPAFAQSAGFRLGKWTEIQNAIIKELNRSYVDSLPVDRIQRAGIDAMLESLDPYTMYVPEEDNEDFEFMIGKTYGGIGAIIYKPDTESNVIINEPYAGSPAANAGLRCGDEIVSIDGKTVRGLKADEATSRMKGNPGTTVVFGVKKAFGGDGWKQGDTVEVRIVRQRIHLPDVEYAGMLNDTTGYILQTGFTERVSEDVRNAYLKLKAQGMKKLVLDLRGNGGGLLQEAVNIVSLFVPKGSVVVSSKGNENHPEEVFRTMREPVDTEIPIVVLVDSGTASSSEIVSGAFQDLDRATILGSRTYGKGLVQSVRPLPYNGQLKVTTAKYYTPSGRCIQAIDYSHRNEDGSVGHIPDSLTREFRTAHGRPVRDGGGITPDDTLTFRSYSRLVYSLVLGGIVDQYALDYGRRHESIAPLDDFHFSDADYEDFIRFAMGKKFDYRSGARALYDQMKRELDRDGMSDSMKDEIEALGKKLEIEKRDFLLLKKDEIIPFIEEEIAVRYYFQEAGVKVRLRYDTALKEALTKPLI